MSQYLARHVKKVAWFLFLVFYSGFTVPLLANKINGGTSYYSVSNKYKPSGYFLDKDFRFSDNENLKAFNENRKQANTTKAGKSNEKQVDKPETGSQKFIGGPGQPEMQSFQSVNANNMVDLFTGDFSYNIPLMDVGGYPVNMHYQSGISMDQESSWIGLGWNINPGTISRNMRGLPDDFNGEDQVSKILSMKENKTVGLTAGANAELIGKTIGQGDNKKGRDSIGGKTTLGFSLGVFHNTYKGWGTETGINAGINAGSGAKGPLSGGLSITNNSQDGLDVSPSFSYRLTKEDNKTRGTVTIGTNYNSRVGIQSLQLTGEVR